VDVVDRVALGWALLLVLSSSPVSTISPPVLLYQCFSIDHQHDTVLHINIATNETLKRTVSCIGNAALQNMILIVKSVGYWYVVFHVL
jgi:hypothetical protein